MSNNILDSSITVSDHTIKSISNNGNISEVPKKNALKLSEEVEDSTKQQATNQLIFKDPSAQMPPIGSKI